MKSLRLASILPIFLLSLGFGLAKEVPAGLRPAKAVDDPEKPIVPKLEEQQPEEVPDAQANPRPTPAVSNGPNCMEGGGEMPEADAKKPATAGAEKPPLIFQKSAKGKRRLSPVVSGSGTQVVQHVIKPNPEADGTTLKPTIRTIPPPAGKDYGVNTLLQTNLVDSKGRVLKGVSSVPIPVPDIRNAKASRASASRVETEAEKAVQINFSG